jgi:hypothetical protein
MNTKIILSIAAGLLIAGTVSGAVGINTVQNQSTMKGYITVGRSVVVLPEMLQQGDRIEFYNTQGELVLRQNVGYGYLSAGISEIPQGVYTMVVFRKNDIIASQMTPFVGNMER